MSINSTQAKRLVEQVLAEITNSEEELVKSFPNLRAVDSRVREVKLALTEAGATQLVAAMDADKGFEENSRRVRLEQLVSHCRTALRFLDGGVIVPRTVLKGAPDISKLTSILPELEAVIRERWLEAQKCQHAKAYTAAVVMMGSVLEGLLLARCLMRPGDAYRSSKAPKDGKGKQSPIQDWSLHCLIEVAVEQGWIKSDRGGFSHALRSSRNIVHPWEHARSRANFDEATCTTCWNVLTASVEDLINST